MGGVTGAQVVGDVITMTTMVDMVEVETVDTKYDERGMMKNLWCISNLQRISPIPASSFSQHIYTKTPILVDQKNNLLPTAIPTFKLPEESSFLFCLLAI